MNCIINYIHLLLICEYSPYDWSLLLVPIFWYVRIPVMGINHLPTRPSPRLLGLIVLGVTGLATERDAAWRPPKWRETAGFSKAKWWFIWDLYGDLMGFECDLMTESNGFQYCPFGKIEGMVWYTIYCHLPPSIKQPVPLKDIHDHPCTPSSQTWTIFLPLRDHIDCIPGIPKVDREAQPSICVMSTLD